MASVLKLGIARKKRRRNWSGASADRIHKAPQRLDGWHGLLESSRRWRWRLSRDVEERRKERRDRFEIRRRRHVRRLRAAYALPRSPG